MSDMLKVNEVSLKYGISKRTIKYYEEIGILQSCREEGSNYRVYDSQALDRLEKILLLRRLDFTLNDICRILDSDVKLAQQLFENKLAAIKDQINALTSLQNVVKTFLDLSSDAGIDNVNIYQLLSEQIYIHKNVERVINMSKYEGDLIRVEIGREFIPDAGLIIDRIKALRSSLKEKLNIQVPLIRITDNDLISITGYRILLRDSIILNKEIKDYDTSDGTLEMIQDLEEVIVSNLSELDI